jgi:fatty acid desaturase
LISVGVFLTKNNYNVITGNSISWLVVFLPPLLAWFFSITGSIFFRTFIKKDAIISITMVIICLLTYQLYIIISTAIQSKPNLNIGYVLIPSIVFGTFSVVFLYFGHFIFQKMFVKV